MDLPNSGEDWHTLTLCPNKGSSQAPDSYPFLEVPPQPPPPGLFPSVVEPQLEAPLKQMAPI